MLKLANFCLNYLADPAHTVAVVSGEDHFAATSDAHVLAGAGLFPEVLYKRSAVVCEAREVAGVVARTLTTDVKFHGH